MSGARDDKDAQVHDLFSALREHVVHVVEGFATGIVRQLEVLEPHDPAEAAPMPELVALLARESGAVVADALASVVTANEDAERPESDAASIASDDVTHE